MSLHFPALVLSLCLHGPLLVTVAANAAGDSIHAVLVGDSTVTDDAGWGVGFAQSFHDTVRVTNLARHGRSSKSFRDEEHWQAVLDADPDFVLIQFGHNDQPGKGPERETDPDTTYRDQLRRYVGEARAAGAMPILVTSLERRRWTKDGRWAESTLAAYTEAARSVAKEYDVVCIDLHAASIAAYRSLGADAVKAFSPREPNGTLDETHMNNWGGKYFGNLVADRLRRHVSAFDAAWNWRGVSYPDPREGQPQQRPLTHGPRGELSAQGQQTLIVDANATGTGTYRTIQAALRDVPSHNADRTVIDIRPGVYFGPIIVGREKHNVTFRGAGPEQTVLTYAANVKAPLSASQGYLFNGCGVTVLGDGFRAEDLTFENTSGDFGQAMALRLQADRVVLRRCRLLGWQDTLLVHSGRHYFTDCRIEGRVDFIYGAATSVFEYCTLRSKRGGYLTAASTPQDQPHGLVFLDCELVSDDGVPAYLGRPWRPFAAVAFIRCRMGAHIHPAGWDNWRDPDNEATARYAEFRSTGPGAQPDARVPWAKQLSADQAAAYTVSRVLGGDDAWDPIDP